MYNGQSFKETAYAVRCPKHGKVFLTTGEYHRQLMKGDYRWSCPVMSADIDDDLGLCGCISEFDDAHFESIAELNWGKPKR